MTGRPNVLLAFLLAVAGLLTIILMGALIVVVLTVLSAGAFLRGSVAYARQRRLLQNLPLETIHGDLAAVALSAGATGGFLLRYSQVVCRDHPGSA